MRTYNPTGVTSRGPTESDTDFSFETIAMPQVTDPGSETPYVDDDANMIEHVDATYYNNYEMQQTIPDSHTRDRLSYESLDTDIATVDVPHITRVADGVARILMKHPNRIVRRDCDMSIVSPGTVDIFDSWVTGSLADECTDAVDSRIAGETPSVAKPLYTTQDHDTPNYVRNPDCWAADLDLTCISPWNSTGGATRAGTLVSPRHIVFAKHYMIGVGATVRFVKMDGTVVDRTMTAREYLGDAPQPWGDPIWDDICVGVLDSDVPAGINFCKILPDTFSNHFSYYKPKGAMALDQEEKATVVDANPGGAWASAFEPTDSQRLAFYEEKISGDSGNPIFWIIDGELILISTITWGGPGSGPCYVYKTTEINAAMTSLGGGYQLTTKDLSAYPTY